MKNRILYSVLALLLTLCGFRSFGTHIIGGELYYTQLDSATYEITLKVYRDCYNGIPWFDVPARIKIFDENGVFLQIHYMYDYTYSELDPYLDSLCIVIPPDVCVQEAIYIDTLSLPFIPGGYQMSYTRCCRNSTILNIIGPDTTGITIHAVMPEMLIDSIRYDSVQFQIIDTITMDTLLVDTIIVRDTVYQFNGSPRFNNFPPILICVGEQLIFDHAATDPDGDSIAYSLCEPFHGGNIPNIFGVSPIEAPPYNSVVWNAPYNSSDPLGGIPLSIDANGELTGTPNTVGQFVVGVCASEYRDGVFLSVNRRDFQFNVAPCLPVPTAAIPANMLVCADSNNTASFEIESVMNALTFNWNFGDLTTLSDTSNLQIPSYTYPDTGYYDIQLIVNEGYTCEDTGSAQVYVQPGVEASFTYQNACFPEGIVLQSTAFVHGGVLSGVEWLLEPGVTSTNSSEIYTFSQYGTYPVSHVATNSYGCSDTVTYYVQQYEKPIANFVADTVCEGNVTSLYSTSQAFVSFIYLYEWEFGDGNTAFGSSTSNQYINSGVYSVTLTTENNVTCRDTIVKDVVVVDVPQANFVSTIGCVGDLTTLYDISISQLAITNWTWWSDSIQEGSIDQNATFYFTAPGTFDMQLSVENGFGCADSITQLIDVYYDPIADFTYTNVCFGDTNLFQEQSSVQNSIISTYQWSFGSNGSSPSPNPLFAFPQAGEHQVMLVVTSLDGCIDTTTQTVNAYYIPEPDFITDAVCLNDTVYFSDSSTVENGTITDWIWEFDNGLGSTEANPNTVYSSDGLYTISLVVTSNQGCSYFVVKTIEVFELPEAIFSYQNVCEGETVDLIDQSVSSDNIVDWTWYVAGLDSSVQHITNYQFGSFGSYPVQLSIETDNGCFDSVTNVIQVFANPTADFVAESDCSSDLAEFTDNSSVSQDLIISWNWDFGDGTSETNQNTTHIFPGYGDYTVQLIVETNNGCIDTITQEVYNLEPANAGFTLADDKGCEPLETSISASPINSDMQYEWGFSNGISSSDPEVELLFEDPGVYGMQLVVTNLEGCSDSVVIGTMFTVYENPESNFEYLPEEASIYGPGFQFGNLSQAPAWSFQWIFGDGEYSTEVSPWHEYQDTGMYEVTLISQTIYGCTDTMMVPVRVNGNFFVYYIPNTFTDNDNFLNDVFNGSGIGIEDYHMYIYDRWGELIFETDDKSRGWNGTRNGIKVQVGTYIYLIEIHDVLGEDHKFLGHVNLVR
ncbi:MAG: PKD domain-containing protein [Flavobacteriales bacterium]|nr:PKD domain-containing protein [Flavobacteriales bacterium]